MSIENEIVEENDANQLLYKFNSLEMPKWIINIIINQSSFSNRENTSAIISNLIGLGMKASNPTFPHLSYSESSSNPDKAMIFKLSISPLLIYDICINYHFFNVLNCLPSIQNRHIQINENISYVLSLLKLNNLKYIIVILYWLLIIRYKLQWCLIEELCPEVVI
jgi:hypothetical protein